MQRELAAYLRMWGDTERHIAPLLPKSPLSLTALPLVQFRVSSMTRKQIRNLDPFLFSLALVACPMLTLGQESASCSVSNVAAPVLSAESEVPRLPLSPTTILKGLFAVESRVRTQLNQHSFKRNVVLQTIGPDGQVTGEYIRNSQFLFDDRGNRIERVLYRPPSTIREMKITKEDIQDLAGAQLLGFDVFESTKYRLVFVGPEIVELRGTLAIDVAPQQIPNPHRMRERFFVGRVWIDPATLQIVKVRGTVEPHGKQRFPIFETWREPVNGCFYFPVRTEADDILRFSDKSVHYRISVRYYDYKQFASKVTVKEID